MQNVAQGWLVLTLTNSAFWLGVVGFAGSIPFLFVTLFGGVIADRVNKRRLLHGDADRHDDCWRFCSRRLRIFKPSASGAWPLSHS